MPLPPPARRLTAHPALAILATPAVAACAGPLPQSFSSPAAARAATTDLLGSLALRFTNVERASRFDAARQKIGRSALSPSGVYDDATVWTTSTPDGVRTLEVEAGASNGQYRFTPRAGAPAPDALGAGRHVVRLARAADGSYQWSTNVEQNVGRFRAAAATEAATAALARLEQPSGAVRSELQATFPRTAAALGRLFSLDDVETAPAGDGTTRVDFTIGLRPERLRAAGLSAFATYVDKYVNGTRWAMTLEDGHGARWGELRNGGGALRLHLRLRDGQLQTLDGAPRAVPDNVLLRTDAYTRVLMFDVGAERLVGNMTFVHGAREHGWSLHWRQPPRWHIPFGMRHLITGALDRPFAGAGMHTDIVLRDPAGPGAGGGTLLVRQFDVTVQESALVRWFGGIGARAMADLQGRAESEQDRFVADMLRALRADIESAYTR